MAAPRRPSRRAVQQGLKWQEPFDPDPPESENRSGWEPEAAHLKAEQLENTAEAEKAQGGGDA